jgi:DNA end-binding protein Ku
MPTAVWTGTLSFGLVSVPVRLVSATEPKDVRFHLYDRSGRRVRYERVVEPAPEPEPVAATPEPEQVPAVEPAEPDAEPVTTSSRSAPAAEPIEWRDLLRGRETEAGEIVMLSHEEIEQVRPQRSQTIDIEDFVDLADIDPVYFEKTYYAIPRSPEAAKPYVLLHRAMREAGRVGIGRFVLRTKPHLVAVRPMRDVLAVETLFFGDEVREPAASVPSLGGEVDERELALAITLIETLKTEWNPDAYADTYREDLLRILAEKSPTAPPAAEPAVATGPSAVEELMASLKRSVEHAKERKRPSRKKAG